MGSIAQKKEYRKYRVHYELADLNWGYLKVGHVDTMAVSEAAAIRNASYRIDSPLMRVLRVEEVRD